MIILRAIIPTIAMLLAAIWTVPVAAQLLRPLPEVAEGVEVTQRLGDSLALELTFRDEDNNYVPLQKYFDGRLPVILSFNYSNCPKLCNVQLQNLALALRDVDLQPGRDFQIVSVSIDPLEQAARARETKARYVALGGNLDAADGWHFLTSAPHGNPQNVQFLAQQAGYAYRYIPEQRIYSHRAAFIFCSPDGVIVRYLDGLDGELARKIRPALLEASEGRVGSLIDRVLFFAGCYVFDEHQGQYTFAAMGIMRIGGVITVIALAIGIIPFWIRRQRRGVQPHRVGEGDSMADGPAPASARGSEFDSIYKSPDVDDREVRT